MNALLQMKVGAALVAAGLAIAGAWEQTPGGVACLVGWFVMVAALHRFGRGGSDLAA